MENQKLDLLNIVTKLAAWHLDNGGFIPPFGAVLGPGRNMKLIKPKSWKENPTREEVEAYWARVLAQASKETGGELVCWCSAVLASWREKQFVPHVLVHIEHREGVSEDFFYPYKAEDGKVVFASPRRVQNPAHVFKVPQRVN